MELDQLRCFLAVAEELHFGRAAQRMDMHPAALGRHIRVLEDDLGVQLFLRTTRYVALTTEGAALIGDARDLVARANEIAHRYRDVSRQKARTLRVGAIDTAAAGLVPPLLRHFREEHPEVVVRLVEDKSVRLLPLLLSGRIDVGFVRPPEHRGKELEFEFLFHETAVVAVASGHRLARRKRISLAEIADEPLIVPDRRSRPHSHDLTMRLFAKAGIHPAIAQFADEKQTIVRLVATGFGIAIVPRWASRSAVTGVRYIPLDPEDVDGVAMLPLALAWMRGARDPLRDLLLQTLHDHIATLSAGA